MNPLTNRKRFPNAKLSRLIISAVLDWVLEFFNYEQFLCCKRLIEDRESPDGWFAGKGPTRKERREVIRMMAEVYEIYKRSEKNSSCSICSDCIEDCIEEKPPAKPPENWN